MFGAKFEKITESVMQNIWEFFQNTSIHGLKYVGSSNLHKVQRIFFAVSFMAVLIFASFFITKTYEKWIRNPTIVGIDPKASFIINEPFPAVTICNMNQVVKSRIKHLSNYSADFAKVQFLCNLSEEVPELRGMHNEKDLIGFLVNISQPCSNMIIYCNFGGMKENCTELFNLIVTSQGVCCIFNMLHPKFMYISQIPLTLQNFTTGNSTPVNWNAEDGFNKNLPKKIFPRITRGTGISVGFTVILNVEANNYYCSSAYSKGFKILLHSPNETPNVQETGLLLNPGRQTSIRIRPEKMQTHPNLRSINVRHRYCLFQNEYRLKYFAHYTQRNCEMECISHVMLKHCGCIAFYLPLLNENTPICAADKTSCVDRVRQHTDTSIEYCLSSCLPSCNDLIFYGDVSTAFLANGDPELLNLNYTDEYLQQNIAVVNMFFKEFIFRSSMQNEFIGTTDFIANIGGIMGLFLGFSFITILEISYYAFLRPLQNLLINKNDAKMNRVFVISTNTSPTQERQLNFRRSQSKQQIWLDYARHSLRRNSITKLRRESYVKHRLSKQMISGILESME